MGFWSKKINFLVFICFLILVETLSAASKIVEVDSLFVDDGYLNVGFHAEGMLDAQLTEQLESGFTCVLEYEIQLWQDRAMLFDQVAADKKIRLKITYDTWEQRFHIISPTQRRRTTSIESVKEWALSYKNYPLFPVEKLKLNEKYAVTVRLLLKPISVENLNEIERALGGKRDVAPDQKERQGRKSGEESRLIRFLISMVGLGDRIYGSPRFEFQMTEDNQMQVTE